MPFGQFYSLLVFLQIGVATSFHARVYHCPSFYPFPFLSLSLFLSFASTFLALLLLLVPHLGCCLLCAYLTVAIRPHFLHFIILFLRIKGEKKRRHAKLSVETFAGRITGQLLKFSTSEISDICLIYYTIKARISLNDKFFAFRDTNNVRDEREDWYSRICPVSYF